MLRAAVAALALAGVAAAPAAAAGPAHPGVTLAAAGAGAIRLAVEVPAPAFLALPGADGAAAGVRLELEGYECAASPDDPGLPARIVLLAVPPRGPVRVSATAGAPEVHDGVTLEGLALAGGGTVGPWPAAWRSATPRARLLEVSWLREQRVARVEIRPADYDPETRRLTLWRRVDVTVQVDAASGPGAAPAPAESADPFERVYHGALLNYEQGRAWRRPAADPAAARVPAEAGFVAAVPETSVYFGRPWIKIAVANTGFYRVSYGLLRNLGLFDGDTGPVPLDSLRLFTWPGVPVLPKDSYCDSCEYREVALSFSDDGDGSFRSNPDEFVFYGMGPSDWASLYDPAWPESVFVNHPYATVNYYYLARATGDLPVGGAPARIATRDGTITDAGLVPPATFPARAHFERDIEYWPNCSPLYSVNDRRLPWERWFWRSVKRGGTVQVTVDLPGADATQAARLRVLTWGLDYNSSSVRMLQDHYQYVRFNDLAFPRRGFNDLLAQVYDTTFTGLRTAGNLFTLAVPDSNDPLNPNRSDISGLGWFDLFYARRFEPVGGRLDFDSPAGGHGDVVYRIGPFAAERTAPPWVFDVTDACRPLRIDGARYELEAGGWYLGFQAAESERRRYRVVPADSIVTMTRGVDDAPATSLAQNLRSRTQQADYIVVYYDGFAAAADSLAAWRRTSLPLTGVAGPFATRTVPVSALYDQFSGGRVDPSAIRNFLRAAYYNWNDGGTPRRPGFVTLLGDASYDFKNLKGLAAPGQPGCLVPTYEDNFDATFVVRRQYVTDDWMLNVDNPLSIIPDFLGGRLPVGDAATALAVVRDKVLAHERHGGLGEWRNRAMLVADDDYQGAVPDKLVLVWTHLRQTRDLDAGHLPPHMDRDYVYLHTYPTGPGFTKPGAKAAIKQGMEDGVALVNFVGHGSPYQLADEKVLLESDIGALANAPRFPVFVTASCDVGKFSDPTVPSLGERLLTSSTGGAVGVISATELSFSNQNAALNRRLYDGFFRRDAVSCRYHVPVAAALLETKAGSTNGQKYQLMGDAATCVALPRLWVELALTDSDGLPVTQVRRGQRLRFSGRVVECPGGGAVPLEGAVAMRIEDSQEVDSVATRVVYGGVTYADSCKYYYDAGAIFRGDAGLSGGEFSGSFVVPLEAREGDRGRLRAYVRGLPPGSAVETDGAGYLGAAVVAGEGPAGDVTGPRIGLAFVGGSTTVRPDAVLTVDLFDENGILTTNHTPQNGIIVTVDGSTTTRADITASFRYAANSFQSGTASYTLPNLSEGAHTVSVSAADNLAAGLSAGQHRSRASLDFTVVAQPTLRIRHAYLFPNPTASGPGHGGGQFVVDAPGDSVNVLLRIYTASGKLIRTLTRFGGLGHVQLPWDGLDEEGERLANGVYFFRVHVNLRDADGSSSAAQKADADGRFVIVNRE